MTTIPQPAALADSFTAVYDAWNRLVRVTNDADNDKTVAEYAYDARNFRIVKKVYDDGALDQTRYAFFSESWQVLEERVDGTASTDVEVQYVWGMRYIDELICRDRDTTSNGIPNERAYALQDANFNVVAMVADDGAVLERYRFTPYGQRTVLNPNFTVHTDPTAGGYAFVIGHQGLMHDIETGMIQSAQRVLHSPLGRFVQRDPAGYVDGLSLYAYVRNNPINWVDPEGTKAFRLDIVAKSFIAAVGGHVGHVPGGWSSVLAVLAAATDIAYNENPVTDGKWDRRYRLYSRRNVRFECRCDKIIAPTTSHRDSRVGREPESFGLQPPAGTFFNDRFIVVGGAFGIVEWSFKGRPHALAEPSFQAVRFRTSVYIWHAVRIDFWCEGDQGRFHINTFTGSSFPSHRLWINGGMWRRHVPQGPLSDLWVPHPADATRVR